MILAKKLRSAVFARSIEQIGKGFIADLSGTRLLAGESQLSQAEPTGNFVEKGENWRCFKGSATHSVGESEKLKKGLTAFNVNWVNFVDCLGVLAEATIIA